MAQNIDQFVNNFSQRIMKEMQLLVGERYPLYINCLGIENLLYLFENRCLITLEGGETPMAYCFVWIESLRFDQCFRPFFRHFATMIFTKLNLQILLVLVGQRKKLKKFFDHSTFN